jgi:phosphoserine phosphatase
VLAFVRVAGGDPRQCSFHSDSIYDLPLLEEVGEPVAVNPDFRLRRIAARRGWPIIDGR